MFAPEQWIYVGHRFTQDDGKLYDAFLPVGAMDQQPLLYKAQRSAPIVGGIYVVEVERDGGKATARIKSAQYQKRHADSAQVLAWQTLHDAADTVAVATRNKKVDALEALEPLRKAYWGTNAVGRRAIEVAVLGYLRSER